MRIPRRVATLSARLVVIILAASHEPALSQDARSVPDEGDAEASAEKLATFSVNHLHEVPVAGQTGQVRDDLKRQPIRKLLDAR
jgi:hypothetical protein